MKRSLKRLTTIGAVAAVAVGLAVAAPTAANAASIGTVKPLPVTGDAGIGFQVQTSADCPAGTAGVGVSMYGGPNSWPTPDNGELFLFAPTTLFTSLKTAQTASNSIQAAALAKGLALAAGTYQVQGTCYDSPDFIAATALATFNSQITLTADATKTVSGYRYDWVAPVAPASSTSVAASPASVLTGATVNLSATVKATALAAGVTTSGQVAWQVGGTTIATANVTGLTNAAAGVTVTGTTTFTTAGTKDITAVFTPADAAVVAASPSITPATVTVTAPAADTTTTLTAPASVTTADVLTLSATVAPAGAAGTVTFKEGATTVGTATVDATGKASVSLSGVAAGNHTYTAAFAPSNPAAYNPSTSAAATVGVTAFAGYNLNGVLGGGENITATVAAGTLTLTAATTPVDLGTLALNATNDRLVNVGTKSLNPVTITDTRAGQLGYTVSGVAGDFTSGSDKINSENLGWTPKTSGTVPATINIVPGAAVAPGDGLAVGATTGAGLKTSRVLAASTYNSATNAGSVGTVAVTADLALKAPTTTKPGVYSTTLVITAI